MEVIFEFKRYKNLVKVTAIDTNTGIEAVVSLPSNLSQKEMQEVAYKRLIYILNKSSQ
jgi:hypothetical protein